VDVKALFLHVNYFLSFAFSETKTFSSPMQMNLGCPTPRAAHDMCSINKYLVIFGGRDADARKNDLHIFDTGTEYSDI
jgi:amphiphysin